MEEEIGEAIVKQREINVQIKEDHLQEVEKKLNKRFSKIKEREFKIKEEKEGLNKKKRFLFIFAIILYIGLGSTLFLFHNYLKDENLKINSFKTEIPKSEGVVYQNKIEETEVEKVVDKQITEQENKIIYKKEEEVKSLADLEDKQEVKEITLDDLEIKEEPKKDIIKKR